MLKAEFGLAGELRPLLSERDQNFRLATSDGQRYVCKIANRDESPDTTAMQIRALLHLERRACAVPTPRVVRTLSGAESAHLEDGASQHVCRVVSYVAGRPISGVVLNPALAASFGQSTAHLDVALQDFRQAGDRQPLLWDLQRAGELRRLLHFVTDAALRSAVSRCLDDFESVVRPALPSLRRQAIHADLNGDNVLAATDDQGTIAGVIDFGDMTEAPLVMEVAIAASYLRSTDVDELTLIRPFLSSFHRVLPLQHAELDLLFDLVRTRLATTITILRWRAATRGKHDEYSSQFLHSERSAETFLARLDALGRAAFTAGLRGALAS